LPRISKIKKTALKSFLKIKKIEIKKNLTGDRYLTTIKKKIL